MSSSPPERPHILCIDDEAAVLDGLARILRPFYSVVTASDGPTGLAMLQDAPNRFSIIVSDMRMPGMDGVTFLSRAEMFAPDAVRVLLTGQADVAASMAAVNQARIFRFLCKPCDRQDLLDALSACTLQHRLVTSKRELLEQTLRGTIATLADALALANPLAFARATRIQQLVSAMVERSAAPDGWRIEVAAMLSQIGAVTLPAALAEKLHDGVTLTSTEQRLVDRLPAIAEQLLAHIPRLETVRLIIRLQDTPFQGGIAPGRPSGVDIPLGARMLKVAVDIDMLEARDFTRHEAVEVLASRSDLYDPDLLELLRERDRAPDEASIIEVTVAALLPGQLVARDVRDEAGVLLVGRGHSVTHSLIERIVNWSITTAVLEPILVYPPAAQEQRCMTPQDRCTPEVTAPGSSPRSGSSPVPRSP